MSGLKICVYAISKNEKHFVERFCESAREADLILIADTGSTDGTAEEAKRCGATVHEICITPWRFDHARNAALALIPRDIDICISLDLDEILEPGWREEIERVWKPETTRLSYYFDWGAGIRFKYEKIHARHGYFWHHPVHEYPVFDKRINEIYANSDMLLVSHHPDPTKSRGQYMDLLELSVKEDPACPRNAFYYCRELTFYNRWNDAIAALLKYLDMPGADWPNERCYAMRLLAKSYAEIGNHWEAEAWAQRAAAEAPYTREPWCDLAMIFYIQSRWPECYAASMRALSIKDKQLVYTCDPAVWGHWAHDLASISAWNMGLKDIALEQAELAVKCTPEDNRLIENLRFIGNAVAKEREHTNIPNIIHMMYFTGETSRPFGYVNYLTIKIAYELQKPDIIYFYYNREPENNPYWERMKKYVSMVQMEPPTEYDGISLSGYPQYWADVVRLQKIYEHGGIYLDTDSMMLKPFHELMKGECVIAGRIEDMLTPGKTDNDFVANCVLMAKPKARFIKLWLDRLAEGLRMNIWAWHAVNLPVILYKEHPDWAGILPASQFLPFDFHNYEILDEAQGDAVFEKYKDCYMFHLWETIWRPELDKIDDISLLNGNSGFARFFGKYADIPLAKAAE